MTWVVLAVSSAFALGVIAGAVGAVCWICAAVQKSVEEEQWQ